MIQDRCPISNLPHQILESILLSECSLQDISVTLYLLLMRYLHSPPLHSCNCLSCHVKSIYIIATSVLLTITCKYPYLLVLTKQKYSTVRLCHQFLHCNYPLVTQQNLLEEHSPVNTFLRMSRYIYLVQEYLIDSDALTNSDLKKNYLWTCPLLL